MLRSDCMQVKPRPVLSCPSSPSRGTVYLPSSWPVGEEEDRLEDTARGPQRACQRGPAQAGGRDSDWAPQPQSGQPGTSMATSKALAGSTPCFLRSPGPHASSKQEEGDKGE